MHSRNTKESAMLKVLVLPTPAEKGSGVTSSISYDNPDFRSALRQMFHCNPNEQITQIEIDGDGITARFELVSS